MFLLNHPDTLHKNGQTIHLYCLVSIRNIYINYSQCEPIRCNGFSLKCLHLFHAVCSTVGNIEIYDCVLIVSHFLHLLYIFNLCSCLYVFVYLIDDLQMIS